MSLPYLEVTLLDSTLLPVMDIATGLADPYVVLFLETQKQETKYKSKIHKNTLLPKFNEIFFIPVPPSKVHGEKISGEVSIKSNRGPIPWKGKWPAVDPKVRLSLLFTQLTSTQLPEISKSHSGGSKKAFYSSMTRSVIRKVVSGERSHTAKRATWLEVKLIEARGQCVQKPPVSIVFNLNSSDKIKKECTLSTNAKWNETFGFEIFEGNKTNDGSIIDGLKIACNDTFHGYVPLSGIKPRTPKDLWVPAFLSPGQTVSMEPNEPSHGDFHIELKVVKKKVEEIEAYSKFPLIDSVASKLMYVSNLVKLKCLQKDISCNLTVYIYTNIVSLSAGVTISKDSPEEEVEETKKKIDKSGAQIEEEEKKHPSEPEQPVGETKGITPPALGTKEKKGVFKKMVASTVDSLFTQLSQAIHALKKYGVTSGTASVIVGFNINIFGVMFGINIEIGIEVSQKDK